MIILRKGDITTSNSDVIVNAANKRLLAGSGVCGAIFDAAGYDKLQDECNKLAPIKTGEAVITNGYNLIAKYIIHTAGPMYMGRPDEPKLLKDSYLNSLLLASKYNLKSISFPSISTGIYGYPIEDAAKIALNTAKEFENDNPNSSIKEIIFYLYDDLTYQIFLNEYNKVFK